jgi:hypothetical protein
MSYDLCLELDPGLPAFAGVMSVLHARRVSPSRIAWVDASPDGPPIARLALHVPGSDRELLARQLSRRVDVREVRG